MNPEAHLQKNAQLHPFMPATVDWMDGSAEAGSVTGQTVVTTGHAE